MMLRFAAPAAATAVLALGMAGCDSSRPERPSQDAVLASEAAPASAVSDASAGDSDSAPSFAVIFPGGEIEGAPVAATGPAGPGGIVTFLTDAPPEAVVRFYEDQTAQAGLSPVMAMNQGEARAFGAAHAARGASLQVVAEPINDGKTSVQLSWSAGT